MCIYYTNRNDLTYKSQEHVIPAGLGGVAKLPDTYVSDQFNNDISKLEQDFLRESIIASIRQIVGPGQRGKLTEQHETKSKVHVLRDYPQEANLSLGYIKKGKPYLIPYINLNTKTGVFAVGFNNQKGFDLSMGKASFKAKCETAKALRIRKFIDNELPKDVVLFGIEKGIEENYDAFFVKNEENPCTMSIELIQAIGKCLEKNNEQPVTTSSKVRSKQTAKWNNEYFRLYAKMAFNALAYIKGESFVLQGCFDNVREWIAKGGEHSLANFTTEKISTLDRSGIEWPKDAHAILFFQDGQVLYAFCRLYNNMEVMVKLADEVSNVICGEGFICDWKNKREYSLQEYLFICANKIAQDYQNNLGTYKEE